MMKQYFPLLRFVLILTAFTSVIFVGMEMWTRPLIVANASAEFKTTILDAYGISYTTPTINSTFEEKVEIVKIDDLNFYVDKVSKKVSVQISGSGVWGPIIGIMTLEPDFKTISRIRITQQEETPGLGGIVATIPYLNKYVGVAFSENEPYINILKPQDQTGANNEVDSITGATRTSNAFKVILNTDYAAYAAAWAKAGNK